LLLEYTQMLAIAPSVFL